MTEDLLYHEPIHTIQQERFGGKDKWWREYLDNPKFRYTQELEAYRKQFRWVNRNIKDGDLIKECLNHYASSLSGEMYGSLINKKEALDKIKQ